MKYRIKEIRWNNIDITNGDKIPKVYFYPQYKKWFRWNYFKTDDYSNDIDMLNATQTFKTLEEAKQFIKHQIELTNPYHTVIKYHYEE